MPTRHSPTRLPQIGSREPGLSRRRFVLLAAAWSAAAAAAGCFADDPLGAPGGATTTGTGTGGAGGSGGGGGGLGGAGGGSTAPFDLPTLGGAPDTPTGRVVAAFVDTVMPGRHRDPTGAPGGIDVGAPAMFFDPELPAAPLVGVLALLLNSQTTTMYPGKTFDRISPDERDAVLDAALTATDLLGFAVQLVMLAYFSAAETADHLGYPGANQGYAGDGDYSFGMPMAAELTADGNLP